MEEDSGLFMQWAMTTLQHNEDLAVAVAVEVAPIDDDRGGATFPSLQALREASQAVEMILGLIGELGPRTTNGCFSRDGDTNDGGIACINTSSETAPRSSSGSATTQPVS